jgi:methylmalonyl-CoA/ethylmalonyl-CoA epimerase
MIKRIAHVGVAVKNLQSSDDLFAKLLGKPADHSGYVERQMARLSFYSVGDSSIELVQPTGTAEEGSSIAKFIEKRGEGIHHLCLDVDDIRGEIARLKSLGFLFLEEEPSPGGDGTVVAFIHPKTTNGVLVELCQRV